MRKLALSKSVGSYSAGTVLDSSNSYMGDDEEIYLNAGGDDYYILSPDQVVELRERTAVVPARNRRDRRKVDKKANEILRGMVENG